MCIVYAICRTIVLTEVELCRMAVQMLLATMLIHTLHAELEDTRETINGVGVDLRLLALHILALASRGEIVPGEIVSQLRALLGFVSGNHGLLGVAVNKAQHGVLLGKATSGFACLKTLDECLLSIPADSFQNRPPVC